MDCPFVPFHIKIGITRHVELLNVAGTLMDQSRAQELRIPIYSPKQIKRHKVGKSIGTIELTNLSICSY
jgi:hypothetical protein